jgi:3-oxoadipate enol-lactonase
MLFTSATHRISYDFIGPETGEVVAFAHALLADGGMWADQVPPLLQAGFRTLRIDMRGHGGSDAPDAVSTVSNLAQDVIELLDHLALPKVHLVGLSIGGVIGQAIAVRAPERLSSLVLSDTNAASAPNAKAIWAERTAIVQKANSPAPLAAGMMPRLLSARFQERRPVRWAEILATIEATRPQGVYAGAQALQNFDFTAQLPALQMPTLVLCGENDPGTPPSEAKKIAELVPGARYVEIPDALHFPNVEQAELYSNTLVSWCREARGR